MTQCEKIYNHLKTIGAITPLEALNKYKCMRLASRMSDLKKKGLKFKTEMVHDKNSDGEPVHYARYRLEDTA